MGKNGVGHARACSRRALKAKAGNLNSILSSSGRYCRVLCGGVSDEICSQRPLWLCCGGWQVDGQQWRQEDPLEGSAASGDLVQGGRAIGGGGAGGAQASLHFTLTRAASESLFHTGFCLRFYLKKGFY